jgi:FkbM family methyltransferase
VTTGWLRGIAARLRRSRLLHEDIVPHGVHAFERATWVIKETPDGVRVWCSLDDLAISRPVMLDAYELPETRFIRATVRPGDYAVDAGANIGYHALHLAAAVGDAGAVDAFEPLPYLGDALAASIAENGFGARLRVVRAALDERAGTLAFRHAPRTANFGGGHVAPATAVPAAHADLNVAAVRLDDVARDRPLRFLKMDVEGSEPRAVRGALRTLAAGRPVVLAELHETQLRLVSGCGATDFIAQMAALGYRCARLTPDGARGPRLARYADPTPVNVVFDPGEPPASA